MSQYVYVLIYNGHNYIYPHEPDENEVWLFSTRKLARHALRKHVTEMLGDVPSDLTLKANDYEDDNGEVERLWVIEKKLVDNDQS